MLCWTRSRRAEKAFPVASASRTRPRAWRSSIWSRITTSHSLVFIHVSEYYKLKSKPATAALANQEQADPRLHRSSRESENKWLLIELVEHFWKLFCQKMSTLFLPWTSIFERSTHLDASPFACTARRAEESWMTYDHNNHSTTPAPCCIWDGECPGSWLDILAPAEM